MAFILLYSEDYIVNSCHFVVHGLSVKLIHPE